MVPGSNAGVEVKLSTHIAFGLGVAGLTASMAGCRVSCWLLSLLASLLVNLIIDAVGHREGLFNPPARTRLTHSIPGVLGTSILAAYIVSFNLNAPLGELYALYIASIVGGLSHWLLDSLNPGGVYLVRRRFRLARIPYYSFTANVLLQMTGGALILYSLLVLSG